MKTSGIPRSVQTFLAATATSLATGGTLVHAKELPDSAKAFTNSLGMKMVPVKSPSGVLWCVWETRNSDFDAYLADRDIDAGLMVRPLLVHGAKPSLGAKGQMPRFTALHAAAAAGDLEVIRLLAGKGADLSATCGESIASPGITGRTPREVAEMNNQWAAAKLLRELDRADR